MKRHIRLLLLIVSVACILSGLGASSASTLQEMAEEIAADVGQVLTVVEGDPGRVICVFEERHDSRLVQIEIAIMLNRLYADYGMQHIGLEGLMAEEGTLDLSWAHWPPPYRPEQPVTGREDVIVQSLIDGEIGGVEMMGLIYEDVVINGIDDADLYIVEVAPEAYLAPYNYLYNIAIAGMSKRELTAWKALYDQEKYREAEEFAIGTDSFSAERYARLEDLIDFVSAEEWLEILDELQAMAKLVKAKLPSGAEALLEEWRSFLEVLSKRTEAMASYMLTLAASNRGVPVCMNIGATHTERVVELFTDAGLSFVVLRSQAQAEGSTIALLSREGYGRKTEGLSVAPDGTLAALLDGRKKTRPIADNPWYLVKEVVSVVLQTLAEQAAMMAKEGKSPTEIQNSLQDTLGVGVSMFGASVSEFLRANNITSFKVMNVDARSFNDRPIAAVQMEFVFKDPVTGKAKKIQGNVWVEGVEEGKVKGEVTLNDLLSGTSEELKLGRTPPKEETEPTSGTKQVTTAVCSDTRGTFTAVEIAG